MAALLLLRQSHLSPLVLDSIWMKLRFLFPASVACLGLVVAGIAANAQCTQNHLIVDGAPSAQRDCQPLAELTLVPPDQMSSAAQALLSGRQEDLLRAATFHGYDLQASGWTYQQEVSPLVQKHLIVSYVRAQPVGDASHFVALIPEDTNELVQVVPAYAHGRRLFDPGWQKKGTFAVYNRLLKNEGRAHPIPTNMEWIHYAALYLALSGGDSAIPTETDSIKATWDLAARRATTPVIFVGHDGSAVIAFSDVSDEKRTISWKMYFNRNGQIEKAERQDLRFKKVLTMQTAKALEPLPPPPPSPLNP